MLKISGINFRNVNQPQQNKKRDYAVPLSVSALALGTGGGFGAFKLGKHTEKINEVSKIMEAYTDELYKKNLHNFNCEVVDELSNDYVSKIFNSDDLANKRKKGVLKPEEFLDEQDLLEYKKEVENLKKEHKDILSKALKEDASKLKKCRNKYLIIGSAIGAGFGSLILAEKFINRKKDEDKKTNFVTPMAILSALGVAGGQIFHLIKENDILKKIESIQKTYAGTIEKADMNFAKAYAKSLINDIPEIKESLQAFFEKKAPLEDCLPAQARRKYINELQQFKLNKISEQEKEILETFEIYFKKGNKRLGIGLAIGFVTGITYKIVKNIVNNKQVEKQRTV